MPQMAPLMWLYLYLFFLLSLMLVLILNFFIKPFEVMSSQHSSPSTLQKFWKL